MNKYSNTSNKHKNGLSNSMPRIDHNLPCDKLHLSTYDDIDLTRLKKLNWQKVNSYRKPFHSAYIFELPNQAQLRLYYYLGGYKKIQLNPTQLGSLYDPGTIVKYFFPECAIEIDCVNFHVDIPYETTHVSDGLICGNLHVTLTRRKRGTDDVTRYFGTTKAIELKVYNSSTKHGLEEPRTRVEIAYNRTESVPFTTLSDFLSIAEIDPFEMCTLTLQTDTSHLSGVEARKADHFRLKRTEVGHHEAILFFKRNARNYSQSYGHIVSCWKPMEVSLSQRFKAKVQSSKNIRMALEFENQIRGKLDMKKKIQKKMKAKKTIESDTTAKVQALETYNYPDGYPHNLLAASIYYRIQQLCKMIASKMINAALIVGEPGVAKTTAVANELAKLGLKPGVDFVVTKGHATAMAIYAALFKHNGKLLIVDDCDGALRDRTALNIFKGALDDKAVRRISY